MTGERHVLLIDDDEPTSRLMRLILEPEGYALSVVSSRHEAIPLMHEHMPDVVIMDYLMSGLPAGEFIEEARSLGFGGPILLCTAMHEHSELAVDDVLHKPFDPDELPRKLASLL